MPLTDKCAYSFNGVVMNKDEFAILEPGCEFCFGTEIDHDFCMAVVEAEMLAHPEESSCGTEQPAVRVTQANRRRANEFRETVQQIVTAADSSPQFESEIAAKRASDVLSKVASAVVGRQPADEPCLAGRPSIPRQEIILRAMAIVESRYGEPVFVGELAAEAEVSERTLRHAFVEFFGIGPVRYLRLRQLHLVHRALKAADPEVDSVADVLVRYGEWEFGRFASRYRGLFGELPSETLRANSQ
jgi:AraC family ethanolamine operon transcriptional activator